MIRLVLSAAILVLVTPTLGVAQTQYVTVPAHTRVRLVTSEPLSSRTKVKGDMVALRTSEDVSIDGKLVIPAGTPAVGQIIDARATGGLGISGKLIVRPLYLRFGGKIVRLTGQTNEKSTVGPGEVIGVALFAVVSGRSAVIPEGTLMFGEVEKEVLLKPVR